MDKRDIQKIDDVTTIVLQEYHTNKLERGLQPQSIISTSKQIKAFFNWCVKENYLTANPMDKVNLPKVRKKTLESFTSDEVYELMSCFSYKNYIETRNKLIVVLMADTGVRVTELTNIKNDDIQMECQH